MPDPKHPVNEAPLVPGPFGVDEDPYTEDDSLEVEDDDEDDR